MAGIATGSAHAARGGGLFFLLGALVFLTQLARVVSGRALGGAAA
jgi:hypothetical protein